MTERIHQNGLQLHAKEVYNLLCDAFFGDDFILHLASSFK